jgi:hypothetical protein
MHDRRSSTVASPDNDPKRAVAPGPGKSTLTGQLPMHTAKLVKGGDDNVDIDHLHKDHAGMDAARLGQSAELATLEHERKHAHSAHEQRALDKQIKQIKHDHLGYQTLKASKYYDPEGRELGDIPSSMSHHHRQRRHRDRPAPIDGLRYRSEVTRDRVAACAAEPHFGMPASAAWNAIAGRAIAVRYAVSIRSNVSPPLRSK